MLVCDLDRQHLGQLKGSLQTALGSCPIPHHVIVIPVREIEAWLLADHEAITAALRLQRPVKRQSNTEAIANPKERLRDLILERSGGRVTYLNTIHNEKIARQVQIENLSRCSSFTPFKDFIQAHLG